ncbi:hypothetical protein [Devosia sp. Root635]|uniref:hypothetical protein n=1 Tax=Devosia sp. Root635 TaxID=1736575 RepID=UPI0006F6582C|nr:hypothetical protein [Devosia sp. Root635]KRA50458.1 hypothetical protein ASD80_15730 [Devosia sp. Root635]
MWRLVFLGVLLLAVPAQAADCTLTNARYKQPDAPWWLTFKRVPRFSAPNQVAAFYLELANSSVEMQGAVHVPNGFGSPLWSIEGPCTPPEFAEEGAPVELCGFLDDGQYPAIYGEYDGAVRFLETGAGAATPEQIILPNLAVSLWYSSYRQTEWLDGIDIGDAFTLEGCD